MASIRPRQRKDGTTSYAVLFLDGGKQSSETFPTARQAERFRKAVESVGPDAARELLAPREDIRTVDDLAAEWLAWKRPDMTTEGHRDYERQYAKWIKPTFGWRDAEMVTERDVQAWVDKTLRPELSPKSVAARHALLHGLFKWASAKQRGYIENNPCTETALPKRRKLPPRGLSLPEWQALGATREQGHRDTADVIDALAGTGWRPGEILGLLAGSVEVTTAGVFVTMTKVYRRGEGIVDGGKTDAAGRRIRVLGPGARVIADRVVGRGINDLVFPHPVTGKAWSPASFGRHYWPKAVEAAGLAGRAPTPYWLRHTHVAMCHAAGMSMPEIQRRIGHESIQTTIDVYGRMIDGMSDDTAARLDALLSGGTTVVVGEIVGNHPNELGRPS